jgi:hypothetical protein
VRRATFLGLGQELQLTCGCFLRESGKNPSPPATRTEEKKLRRVRTPLKLLEKKLLSDRRQEVALAAPAPGAIGIVAFFNDQSTKGFYEVSKTHSRGTPFGANITGETVPNGISGNEIRVEQGFFDDTPRRTAKLHVTEVLGQRATCGTFAALEATRKIAFPYELIDLSSTDLHFNTLQGAA